MWPNSWKLNRFKLFSGGRAKKSDGKPPIIWDILNFLHRLLYLFLRIVLTMVYGRHGKSMPPIDDRLLLESATSLAEKIRKKEVTSTQVMNAFIKRIKQINPLLNCAIDERFRDALQEAVEVDQLIASNEYTVDELKESKPFLGVPLSTKDSIGVKGMVQSCGFWQKRGARSSEDADAVQLMRSAGAIPFVITNVPELCMWWETSNKIHGRTRNPYDICRTSGGSSGGEGCLLAAAGSPFGLGSDIGGSIRVPAFFNGIFGHKPSPFVVSNNGQWPKPLGIEELHALTIGPMCRFACDLKPMLKVVAGEKAKDLRLDEPVDLSRLNYFYQENDGGALFVSPVGDDIRVGIEKVIKYLKSELNVKPERMNLTILKDSLSIWMSILKDEKIDTYETQLADVNGPINPYKELLKWFIGISKHTLIAISVAIRIRCGVVKGSQDYQLKLKECNDLRRKFEQKLDDDGVFIYPTHPTVAPYHNEPLVRPLDLGYTAIFNVLGLPSTAVPLGLGSEGLPVGLQVVANRNQDRLCLAVASELEKAFGGWVAPEIIVNNLK